MAKSKKAQIIYDEDFIGPVVPVHPAAHFGHHAVKLFEDAVEQTTVIRRSTKSSEALINAGLLYDRYAGVDEYGFETYHMSARLDAWEDYCAYLDYIEPEEQAEDVAARLP